MRLSGLHPASLDPPAPSLGGHVTAPEKLPYLLLEVEAYVAKRDNATTAFSKTCDGKRIQATLCSRRPPLVSYVCIHSPDAAEINYEPDILAVEEELILLRLIVGAKGEKIRNLDYYVYQPADGVGDQGEPSLTLLPRPPSGYGFSSDNIGILGYSTADSRRAYILAGLNQACYWKPAEQFDFCLYDSKLGFWKTLELSLSQGDLQQHGGEHFYHRTWKVMATGARTMAFVDLWQGIVFLDDLLPADESIDPILPLSSHLSYVKLPRPLQRNKTLQGDAHLYRDIAVIGNHLRYVELQVHYKPSVLFEGQFIRKGWMAATWTRPASDFSSGGWQQLSKIMDSQELKINSDMYFDILPKVLNDEGTSLSTFIGIDVCQPVLGGDGTRDVIYFTAKRRRAEADGWVVSVDLENKELLGCCSFASERYRATNFAYMRASLRI